MKTTLHFSAQYFNSLLKNVTRTANPGQAWQKKHSVHGAGKYFSILNPAIRIKAWASAVVFRPAIKAGCISLFGLVLMGCQSTVVSLDVSSQSYLNALPAGTELELHQDIVVPAGVAHVSFQYGKQLDSQRIDRYQPWCEFEINTLTGNPQTIHADSFVITKLVNQRSGFLDGAGTGSASRQLEEFSTVLYLQSAAQPDVLRLSCLWRKGNRMQTYLRFTDIQSAMGNVFSINVK